MRTGLTKKQKITNIYFTEADDLIEVCTYNTDLKKRLAAFAAQRQTAVVSVIVGAAPGHQLSDGASFLCCQFSCGFCHRHNFSFLNFLGE